MAKNMKPLWGVWDTSANYVGWSVDVCGGPLCFMAKAKAKEVCCDGERVRRIGWYDPEPLPKKRKPAE